MDIIQTHKSSLIKVKVHIQCMYHLNLLSKASLQQVAHACSRAARLYNVMETKKYEMNKKHGCVDTRYDLGICIYDIINLYP